MEPSGAKVPAPQQNKERKNPVPKKKATGGKEEQK